MSIFLLIVFVSGSNFAHAGLSDWVGGLVGNVFYGGMQVLLYMVFVFVGWFTSVALALFEYAVDPQYMSGPGGLMNLQATYDMWKFVRDFINIGFILGLLFIAFAFIFQIDSYSDKKVIIKLVIAALLVNFSFPLARFIIDLANVPMYFFLQMIAGNGTASAGLSSSLSASHLEKILIPAGASSDVSSLLAAIIFLFIFNITLLVFAFQFLIRLIALVILVVLSPIGFVASGIPGLKKYGSQWWDNFLKYCLFGPAAMFMLLLSVNFFAAISKGDQYSGVVKIASSTSPDPGFIASMVLFFIPITMLWFAMGISGKFSVAGASVATKYGQDFAKLVKKKSYNNRIGRGLKKGAIERAEKIPVLKNFTPKYAEQARTSQEAFFTGVASGGGGIKGYNKAQDKFYAKKVGEQEKKFEEERTSETELRSIMKSDSADKVKREAAVRALSKKEALRSGDDMQAARDALALSAGGTRDAATGKVNIDAISDNQKSLLREKKAEVVKKAGAEIYKTGNELAEAIGDLGNDVKGVNAFVDKAKGKALDLSADQIESISAVRDENGNIQKDASGNIKRNESIFNPLKGKIRKEGNSHNLVSYYERGDIDAATGVRGPVMSTEEAVKKVIGETKNIEDLVKQEDLFVKYKAEANKVLNDRTLTTSERFTEFKEEAHKKSPKIAAII